MTKPTKVLSQRDTTDSQNFQSVLCIPQHVSSLRRKREKNSEDSIADETRGSVVNLHGVKHIFDFLKAGFEEIIFRRAGQKINNIDTQSLRDISAGAVLFPLQTLIAN